ncbi:hypothetical protein JHD46_05480 [Sulfurimonas sp. SAG-AH-194-C20]|nr:hypothetical protein [Sulfurimonas sp. SAG-AH-194-C20]MDF1879091.1 hypothetical protein [Sulfurimonas sp. SAG-AH-194-C20]
MSAKKNTSKDVTPELRDVTTEVISKFVIGSPQSQVTVGVYAESREDLNATIDRFRDRDISVFISPESLDMHDEPFVSRKYNLSLVSKNYFITKKIINDVLSLGDTHEVMYLGYGHIFSDSIEDIIHSMEDSEDRIIFPLYIKEYRRIEMSLNAKDHISSLLETLDEDYGDIDADGTSPSEELLKATEVFIAAVKAEYRPSYVPVVGMTITITEEEYNRKYRGRRNVG